MKLKPTVNRYGEKEWIIERNGMTTILAPSREMLEKYRTLKKSGSELTGVYKAMDEQFQELDIELED